MDLRSLRYFVAAYEEQSVSGAAKRCFVAQPSISTAIAQMEERLGVRLFLRHPKGVTPTTEAKTLYGPAARLLGEFEALGRLFDEPEALLPFDLAVMPTIDARRIGEFLKLITDDTERLALRIVGLEETADARIVADRLTAKSERFLHLWDEEFVLALPYGHRLTLQPTVGLEELDGERFIERCLCEVHDEVTALLARNNVKPQVVARAHNEEWAAALVSAGLGVALVPESSVLGKEDTVVTRAVEGLKLVRRVGLAYDHASTPSPGLRAVLELLENGGASRRLRWV